MSDKIGKVTSDEVSSLQSDPAQDLDRITPVEEMEPKDNRNRNNSGNPSHKRNFYFPEEQEKADRYYDTYGRCADTYKRGRRLLSMEVQKNQAKKADNARKHHIGGMKCCSVT